MSGLGDSTLPTPEAVRAATESARAVGGYMAGVVFFRWPTESDHLAIQPEEVLIAAGLSGRQEHDRIESVSGHCAAVECVDLYLESAQPLSERAVRYRIRSSTELEYFLPDKSMPVQMTGPSQLELSLPPYCTALPWR